MNGNTTTIEKCCVKDVSKYYYRLFKPIIASVVEIETIEWEWISLLESIIYKVYRALKLVKNGHMSNICQTFETTEFHKFSGDYYTFEELQ